MSSAADEPLSLSGRRLPKARGVTQRSDVIPFVQRSMRLHWEPNWGIPPACIDVARCLQLANFNTVSMALGATPSPVEPLRHTRNFLAHRKPDTQLLYGNVAVQLGHPRSIPVDQMVSFVVQGVGPRFEMWVAELRIIAQACIR